MKRPEDGGSRLAIVFNGSPLFTGAAGSGESEIRRWIIENDWLEAVVALPDQLFYNTGISTYFWIVTNRKSPKRRGKVQLIDARDSFTKMRKSLGEKRKQIADADIDEIVRSYGAFEEHDPDTNDSTDGVRPRSVARSSPTKRSGSCASPSNDPYESAGKSPTTPSPRSPPTRKSQPSPKTNEHRCSTPSPPGTAEPSTPTQRSPKNSRRGRSSRQEEADPARKAVLAALTVSDPDAEPQTDKKGNPEADSNLRDNENVPLPATHVVHEPDPTHRLATPDYRTAVDTYLTDEVLPYVPDAWVDHTKTKIGYEIPLTRHFYTYTPPRPLAEIDAEIKQLENEIQALLNEVTE